MTDSQSNPVFKAFNRANRITLIALTAIGIAFVLAGAWVADRVLANLLLSGGAAIFGAAASLLIGEVHRGNVREELRLEAQELQSKVDMMRDVVRQSLGPGVTCSEEEVKKFRELWHHYYVTKVAGKTLWRYRTFDFRESHAVGRLTATINASDNKDKPHQFTIEAGYRESRFFLFSSSVEVNFEPVSIEIYPFLESQANGTHCGIGIEQTMDGPHMFYRCILAKNPQLPIGHPAGVDTSTTIPVPEEHWGTLEDVWRDSLNDVEQIRPNPKRRNSKPNTAAMVPNQ